MKPFEKAASLRRKPKSAPLDSMAPRATLRLYAQSPVDMEIGMEVNPLFAAFEAVVNLAVANPAAEDTVDCKC